MYTDINYIEHIHNCIMGMNDNLSMVPVCIHSLIKLRGFEDNNYYGAMYILQKPVYNNMTVGSEWKKIMELRGYETGLVIDDSRVAENCMNTIQPNYYKEI